MPRTTASQMGLPPFQGAVRQIIIASIAIYVVEVLLLSFAPNLGAMLIAIAALSPERVLHGWIWQLVTYVFIYGSPLSFVLSLLFTYLLGSMVEVAIGSRRFYYLFFGSAILSGVIGILLSLTGVIAQGSAAGSGPVDNAIFMIVYLFSPDSMMSLLFTPFRIPIKWMLIFTAIVETAYVLLDHFALADLILLLGLGVGYIWYVAFLTERRKTVRISEKYYSLRNSYYRWKRRRAARKFEVYMRDHDRTVTFDEHGNYIPPEDSKKGNGGSKSGWVN